MKTSELWKPVIGWPEYAVSNLGRVKRISHGQGAHIGKILKHRISPGSKRGYSYVTLCHHHGQTKNKYVHRLVTAAFLGPCSPTLEVNHRNSNRCDPRLANLEYVTSSENHRHAYRLGRIKLPLYRGMDNPKTTLSDSQIRLLRKLHKIGISYASLAKRFHICRATIWNIISHTTWSHIN